MPVLGQGPGIRGDAVQMGSKPASLVRADLPEESGDFGQVAGGGALPRGPAGSGRVPGGGEETAGVLREEVLERLLWCLRCLESDLFLYK